MNDQLVKDFIDKYFNQALKSFLDYQKQLEDQIRRTHGLPPLFPSVSAWTKAMIEPFATAFTGRPLEPRPPASETPSEKASLEQQVRELQAQVEALRARPRRRPARKRRRSG